MNEEEFNLSNKIECVNWGRGGDMLWADDVKEFIERLKEELGEEREYYVSEIWEAINKLAGEKLKDG